MLENLACSWLLLWCLAAVLVVGKNDDIITGSKQLTVAEATPLKSARDASGESAMRAELRKLRQENSDSFRDLKTSLQRVESSMQELKQQTERLDRRLTDAENRVDPERSVIARFLDFNVKQKVLLQAWTQRNIQFRENRVYCSLLALNPRQK